MSVELSLGGEKNHFAGNGKVLGNELSLGRFFLGGTNKSGATERGVKVLDGTRP